MTEEKQSPDLSVRRWLKCPNCGWTSFRYRRRLDNYACIHCGAIFILEPAMRRTKLIQPPIFEPRKVKGR